MRAAIYSAGSSGTIPGAFTTYHGGQTRLINCIEADESKPSSDIVGLSGTFQVWF